jgi:hypothetical protein
VAPLPRADDRRAAAQRDEPAAGADALRFSFIAFLIAAAASWLLRGGTYRWSAGTNGAEEPAIARAAALSR